MTHFEARQAATLLSLMFSVSIRATALGGLTWGLLKVLRTKAAAVRHASWTAVLIAMLLMPFLRTALPPVHLPLLPFSTTQSTPVRPMHRVSNLVGETISAGDTAKARFFQTETLSITSRWPVMILALYAAGALFLVLRQSIGYFVAGSLVRSSQLLGTTDVVTLKHRLPSGVKIPDLRRSSLVRVPIVVGILKPSIILPADWSAWKEEKLAAVLAHELSHVQRCDTLVRFLSAFNRCLYWFHPLAWWLDRHLSELAEQVSDDSALVAVSDRRKYAEVLLGFAATASKGAGRVRWAGLAMASTSHLGVRIERILSSRDAAADRLARRTLILLLIAAPFAAVSTAAIELTSGLQMPSSKSNSVLSTGTVRPQSFVGTWQGIWHDTWMGSRSSISVTLNVKVADGRLSGAAASTVQKQPLQKQNPAPSPGTLPPQLAPPPPPPPPPLPTPPAGAMLDPRVEGRTLVFKVKAPDAKVVNFQLTLQSTDTGTLKVTFPTHWRSDFEMKKMQ